MNQLPLRMGPACYHVLHIIPPMVAHEMNYLVEEGLQTPGGEEAYDFVLGGLAPFTFEMETLQQVMKERAIDVAMDVKPSTVAATRLDRRDGPKLFIVAGWRNQQPNCVVARDGIGSLGDLKGKRVGVIDKKDVSVSALAPSLRRAGLDPYEDIDWIRNVNPRKAPQALRAGTVDAGMVAIIDVADLERDGFKVVFSIPEQYPDGRPDRIIVATEQALAEKRDQVKAFLKGMLRAYWFIRTQPENFRYLRNLEIRLRRHSEDPDERRRELAFMSPEHGQIMPFPFDGLPREVDTYLQEAVLAGELRDTPAAAELSDFSLVEEAFADLSARPELAADLNRAKEVSARWGF